MLETFVTNCILSKTKYKANNSFILIFLPFCIIYLSLKGIIVFWPSANLLEDCRIYFFSLNVLSCFRMELYFSWSSFLTWFKVNNTKKYFLKLFSEYFLYYFCKFGIWWKVIRILFKILSPRKWVPGGTIANYSGFEWFLYNVTQTWNT